MKMTIMPGKARGFVQAPPSKSMAHRLLMGAGLSEGQSRIRYIELSEDIKATLGILEALGATYTVEEDTVIMRGVGKNILHTTQPLDCNESGSTLRFFVPLVCNGQGPYRFIGAKRLMERPLSVYESLCKEQGIRFEKSENGLWVEGTLKPGHFQVRGDISSQFITGLLYALPMLAGESVLEVLPPVESKAYIEMTLYALDCFGIHVRRDGYTFYIDGNQTYHAKDVEVEGDYSNAAFLEALQLIGGEVQVKGLQAESLQGDAIYQTYFKQLKESAPILDISECPDLGPILMGMAAVSHGARFTGTRRLKMKESDRGVVMSQELAKFGIQVDVFENEIVVHPGTLQTPTEILDSHNDHRIAMTMAVLCTLIGGTITCAEAVKKSFPTFCEVLESLGIETRRECE